MLSQSYDKILRSDVTELTDEKVKVKVSIENPKGGINLERLFMALNLILSEEDILNYMDIYHEFRSPIQVKDEVSTKTA